MTRILIAVTILLYYINNVVVSKLEHKKLALFQQIQDNKGFSVQGSATKIKNRALLNEIKPQCKEELLPSTILTSFREAMFLHPFKTWGLKHKFSSMKDIRVHEDVLHNVIDNPTNDRLNRKLYKVLQGKDVYLDVFGGSNSIGAGLSNDGGDIEGRYTKVITEWWTKAITPITKSRIKFRQIALGGTSSEFFQFCFGSYIHEKLDLVFVESAVNDMRDYPLNANKSLPLEQLSRQLLDYPTKPALVYVNLFGGVYCQTCTNLEDYGLDMLTDAYNITSLKWRNAVCCKNARNNITDPCSDLISSDGIHINQLAHAHISLMVINLFRRILIDHLSVATSSRKKHACPSNTETTEVVSHENRSAHLLRDQIESKISFKQISLPRPLFINKSTKMISNPLCWTGLTPNYFCENCVKNKLDIAVINMKNFQLANTKMRGECKKPPCRTDAYTSWTGETLGARITFVFTISRVNTFNAMKNTRSVAIALRTSGVGGAAYMWLDGDYEKRIFVNTKLRYGRTSVVIIALHVAQGHHNLNVEIVKKGEVSIVALIVGPKDGPY